MSEMRMELTLLIVRSNTNVGASFPGANFLAGSPKYFGPILHYLRTNSIDIPSDYKLSSMRMEAEYYGIQKIVDHIDFLEAEKKQEDKPERGVCINRKVLTCKGVAWRYLYRPSDLFS